MASKLKWPLRLTGYCLPEVVSTTTKPADPDQDDPAAVGRSAAAVPAPGPRHVQRSGKRAAPGVEHVDNGFTGCAGGAAEELVAGA